MSDTVFIRVGLLEDETPFITQIRDFLDQWKDDKRYYALSVFGDGEELLRESSKIQFDILFLDIVLPNGSGIVVAHDLRRAGYKGLIVFQTKYSDYWPSGYDVGAYQYFLKPIKKEDFFSCMDAALEKRLGNYYRYSFKDEYIQIPFDEIFYFMVQGHYTYIYTENGNHEFLDSIRKVCKILPDQFVQCHRSFVVNLDRVRKFSGKTLSLDNGEIIYASKSYLPNLRHVFIKHMK